MSLVPGLLACAGLAVAARLVATSLGIGIETTLALVGGLLVGLIVPLRPVLRPGARLAGGTALRIGVALLGARLTLDRVLEGGLQAALAAALVVAVGLSLGWWAGRRLGLDRHLGALIPAGMAICGNSAILALAPVIGAKDRDVTYAVTTITLFGLAGVVLLPFVGRALGLADATFGTWAGLAVNDTAQVVATGYAYSGPAGDTATIVKLTRNLAIAPLVIGAALAVGRSAGGSTTRGAVVKAVPWFVIGFVVLAAARSAGLLDASLAPDLTLADLLAVASGGLILLALAGLGIAADLRATLSIGARPFGLGVGLWVIIVLLGLGLAVLVSGQGIGTAMGTMSPRLSTL